MGTKPTLSIIVTTVRDDEHPYAGRPDLHLWDTLATTLAAQQCRPGYFELIIVDGHWEQHGDWFAEHPQRYAVKHVPASPNAWHDIGASGACAQLNRGIAWAEGTFLFFCHENVMFPPHFVSQMLAMLDTGLIPIATYVEDHGCCDDRSLDECTVAPMPYDLLGYTGTKVHEDHRLRPILQLPCATQVPWEHYFTFSTLPYELALRINGWNECMDGIGILTDCDVGSRIEMSGYGKLIVGHPDLWCVRAVPKLGHWSAKVRNDKKQYRCNYALLLWHRWRHETRAGALAHTGDGLLDEMEFNVCGQMCPLGAKCKAREVPDPYPFIYQRNPEIYREWRERVYDYDLASRVRDRRAGKPPFDRGFIHGPA